MKKLVGFGAFYCPMCGGRLEARSDICPVCGADTGSGRLYTKWCAVPCAEKEKRRRVSRYRRKELLYKLLFGLALAFAVPRLMFASGQLRYDDEGYMVDAVLAGMFLLIALVSAVRSARGRTRIYTPSTVADGMLSCQVCGSVNDARSAFCIKCGCALPHAETFPPEELPRRSRRRAEAEETEETGPEPDGGFCPSCGEKTAAGSRFCESCGQRL